MPKKTIQVPTELLNALADAQHVVVEKLDGPGWVRVAAGLLLGYARPPQYQTPRKEGS